MSNRVSPAPPTTSPLPPVDSPIPDDVTRYHRTNNNGGFARDGTVETIQLNSPPPPPSAEGPSRDYTPAFDESNVTEAEVEQAIYHPPDEDKDNVQTVADDDDDNNVTTSSSPTPLPTSTGVLSHDAQKTSDEQQHQFSSPSSTQQQNARESGESNQFSYDDDATTNNAAASSQFGDSGVDGDEHHDEEGSVRHRRRPKGGRLPPLADSSPRKEQQNQGDTGDRDSDSRINNPMQQQQQQHQGGYFNDNNSTNNYNQQHQGQQHRPQEFAMSARPNSGISVKDRADDSVIGANNAGPESGCCAIILTGLCYILVVLFLPFSLCMTIKVVQEYERAVIFRLGRLLPGGAKGPGIFFVMPCIEEYTKVDLRTVSFDVPPQEVLTRDSVTVSVDAVVYYRISNPTVSVANVENAANSTQLLAQTTLRNVLGTQNLAEILSNREHISEQMQIVLDGATDKWGIKVERVEIKDVRLPTQLQRAMATEAEAARDARAKVIAAEGEQKASVALKEAADIIADSPAAMQLRYLQTLNSISAEKNSTIIFPLPIELIGSMMK